MLRVIFLGTAASRPTAGRGVSAVAVQREGELLLFDCGEGTQRQMMRFGTGFAVQDIFFTHIHADHFLGLTGLLRTMALQGSTQPVRLWAPEGCGSTLHAAVNLGIERVPFDVVICELTSGQSVPRPGFDIIAYRNQHGTRSLGFAIIEHQRLGRFHPEKALALGVPEGPLFGRLHRGDSVEIDGRVVSAADVVGAPRPGRRVVYSGDTRPCRATVEIARNADLLIHDATFGDEEADRARETWHSTAREAGEVARAAGVVKLVLTHISARYADDPRTLERQALGAFPRVVVAHDGLTVDVPFRDGEAEA
jgi:ribonuclease Z